MSLSLFDAEVPRDALGIWWLGQAGFVFKTPADRIVYFDPYLSDAAEKLHGFKRLSLPPIVAEQVRADLVVMTHEHVDHLDPDALPIIARNNPACRFAGPAGCTQGLIEADIDSSRRLTLEPYQRYDLEGLSIHCAPADHGDLSPTALSLLLDFAGIRILCTGDTSFRPELLKPLYGQRPDVLVTCINGVFGNMSHLDAAMLVKQVYPRYAIPCHFWMFAEHGAGDPNGFVYACKQLCPKTTAMLLKPGERFLCGRE